MGELGLKLQVDRTSRVSRGSHHVEVWFQALLAMSSDAIFLVDEHGKILYASPSLERVLGYSPADLLDRSGFDLVHPDDMSQAIEILGSTLALAGSQVPFQLRVLHQDASWRWVEGVCGNQFHNQAVEAIVVNFRDVTEQRRAAEALRESRQQYQSLVANLPVCLFRKDQAGRFTYVNQRFGVLLGKSPAEVVGKTDCDFFPIELAEAYRRDDQHVKDTKHPLNKEEYYQPLGGERRFVEVIKVPVQDGQGQVVEVQGILWDITERKEAQERLRESEDRFRALIEHGFEGFNIVNEQGQIVYSSPGNQALLGYAASEVQGRGIFETIHPDDMPEALAVQAFTRQNPGKVCLSQIRCQHKNGSWRWMELSARNLLHHPAIQGAVINWRDITEWKRAEEDRHALEAKMQHSQKLESLGVLAGGIAHDFNNLLTVVLGYSRLALAKLPAESPAVPMIRETERAAQRAADLTRQMLAYSGKGLFISEPLRLDTLVQEMTGLLQSVVSKKATFELALEPATIEGGAAQIRQVVMNLITNASDALGEKVGLVRVRTGVLEATAADLRSQFLPDELPAGRYAFVEVEDSGCGMNEETLNRVFDPFFTTKVMGRGLGLAAVLGIVRGHRGTIKIASTPEQGAVFQVLLPATATELAESASRNQVTPPAVGQGMVLIVEDEPGIRVFAQRVLEVAGFQVRTAEDGLAGLQTFARHQQEIVAVLLDLTMPRMDGWDLLRQLRRLDPVVPILVMSGHGEQEVAASFAEFGASGFIQKPFLPQELVTRVCQWAPPSRSQGGR